MSKKVSFGIIGAGRIAQKFARGISYVEDAELIAVASRSIDKAEEFGHMFDIKNRYGSYEELVADEEVDVVYICTPNSLHKEHTILCLENKKAVICEKPFGVSQDEVEEMIQAAKDNGVFLMEAMWTRFFPIIKKVKELVEDGLIGQVKMIQGDFGFESDTGYEDIRFNKDLGGGSIFDVGIYPISLSSMIYQKQPTNVRVMANIGKTGVDEEAAMILGYDKGEMALLSSAITTETPRGVDIIGDKGYIQIPNAWYGEKAIIQIPNKETQVIDLPMEGNGYNYEVEEVVRCLQNGQLESDIMPLKESLAIIATVEKIRQELN